MPYGAFDYPAAIALHKLGGPKIRSIGHSCGSAMIRLAYSLKHLEQDLMASLLHAFQDHHI
eukprot:9884272-Karenia_brevis.AAC.1